MRKLNKYEETMKTIDYYYYKSKKKRRKMINETDEKYIKICICFVSLLILQLFRRYDTPVHATSFTVVMTAQLFLFDRQLLCWNF